MLVNTYNEISLVNTYITLANLPNKANSTRQSSDSYIFLLWTVLQTGTLLEI